MSTQTLIIQNRELDGWITAWLDAKKGKCQSVRTMTTYQQIMTQFRRFLWQQGLDLDSDPGLVALAAQAWAKRSLAVDAPPEATVSNASFNLRLAALSSFYRYWQHQQPGREIPNPIARVERGRIQEYASAEPLSHKRLEGLHKIDLSTKQGLRDYALLQVALKTGRRASELAALRKEHVNRQPVIRDDGTRITLYFKRCKGGKQMSDTLSPTVSAALRWWINRCYGSLAAMPTGAPLWPVLVKYARGKQVEGQPMTTQTIADICEKYLGTSKIHATRHTFAHEMETAGAKVSEIAARLGHANPAITGRYLAAMHSAENPYAELLDKQMNV